MKEYYIVTMEDNDTIYGYLVIDNKRIGEIKKLSAEKNTLNQYLYEEILQNIDALILTYMPADLSASISIDLYDYLDENELDVKLYNKICNSYSLQIPKEHNVSLKSIREEKIPQYIFDNVKDDDDIKMFVTIYQHNKVVNNEFVGGLEDCSQYIYKELNMNLVGEATLTFKNISDDSKSYILNNVKYLISKDEKNLEKKKVFERNKWI